MPLHRLLESWTKSHMVSLTAFRRACFCSMPAEEKVNIKLRALFASMLWFPVLETESGKLQRTRTALADCIRAHVARDCIELSFCASRIDDAHMAALARSMHKNLATVDLNFCMCPHVTAKGMEDVAKCLPAKLRTLRLNFKRPGSHVVPLVVCGTLTSFGCIM